MESWTLTELIDACDGAVNARTVRYWISEGLLPAPTGGRGPQARYERAHAERITEIRRLQSLGLSLENIGLLVGQKAPASTTEGHEAFWLKPAARPAVNDAAVIELAPGLRLATSAPLDPVATAALAQAAAPLVALYLNLTTPKES